MKAVVQVYMFVMALNCVLLRPVGHFKYPIHQYCGRPYEGHGLFQQQGKLNVWSCPYFLSNSTRNKNANGVGNTGFDKGTANLNMYPLTHMGTPDRKISKSAWGDPVH